MFGDTTTRVDGFQNIPEPLNVPATISQSTWMSVARANRAIGRLDQASLPLLYNVSARGTWDLWIDFFSLGIKAAAEDTRVRVEELLRRQGAYQERVQQQWRF